MQDEHTSPLCEDDRHFQCSGWWWVIEDKVALTCTCWCHRIDRADIGASGPH